MATRSTERGVYFDAWFPRQHCYHPSLPPRRLRMVDDLRDYRATSLVWSALGGGSISLPYLEQEAFGEVDARSRVYGFVNDSEFIAECDRHGIKVFGIVFEVQGWEYPAELSDDEDRVLALNELRDAGKRAWLGLREFSQDRYPKLWPSFRRYFPDGLRNSDGEEVTDLLEECCSRDIDGEACHARWVECPDREHYCYAMDRNNPVWMEYLKAIVRIQIDAGVHGVQLDEAELPITSLQYGGCFCKDCMKGFRRYLQALPGERLPAELEGADLDGFHYGEWLRARGYDFKHERESTPLFWDYLRFQRGMIAARFGELADYAREYARGKGRDVLVSGNFFNLFDHYYALEPKVDVVITEMRNTAYRQPAWYRYVAGFCGEKPVIVVENPYGGVVPELVERLKQGRAYDLFRLSLYEAAALGASMSVPYGSWMGSVIEDSWYAPHELCVEVQGFLADHEQLFGARTFHEVAVVYSVESAFAAVSRRDLFADNRLNVSGGEEVPFWSASAALADAAQPYDVLFFPDGELRPDELTAADLRGYRTLVLPDCRFLTDAQAALLEAYLEGGGALIVIGRFGENLPHARRDAMLAHDRATRADGLDPGALPGGAQAAVEGDDLAFTVQRLDGGRAAVHVVRYRYDDDADAVPPLARLVLDLRLPAEFSRATSYAPGREPATAALEADGERHRLLLEDVGLYTIVELRP